MHKNFEQKQNIKKYFITKNRLKYSITKTDIISSSRVVKKKKKHLMLHLSYHPGATR